MPYCLFLLSAHFSSMCIGDVIYEKMGGIVMYKGRGIHTQITANRRHIFIYHRVLGFCFLLPLTDPLHLSFFSHLLSSIPFLFRPLSMFISIAFNIGVSVSATIHTTRSLNIVLWYLNKILLYQTK